MTPTQQFEQFIEENKITVKSKFVPFSLSRNAEEKDKSLNWKVTIMSPKGQYTCDYMKGIGHLPYPQTTFMNLNAYQASGLKDAIDSAVETGVAKKITLSDKKITFGVGNAQFPDPTLKDILESLSLDANVKDYLRFESWASDFGYNVDSREAEKTYKSCQKAAEGLSKVLGGTEKINKLTELLYEIDNEPTPKKVKP
ncbi:hypothetical protein GW796_00715 [archaeon]|nr:hypothetical protein [archaeon]NCQ50427.1 hypothetical protein [archaeon]